MCAERWTPIEANPEVLNEYMRRLGFDTDAVQWTDVFSLDDEMLAFIPQPCYAFLVLFPLTDKMEEERRKQASASASGVWFMHQTIENACGSVGLVHALMNAADLKSTSASWNEFVASTLTQTPADRAVAFGKTDLFRSIHHELAEQGQSAVPDATDDVNLHYLCLVQRDGALWDLDGRQPGPVKHGKASDSTEFFATAVDWIRQLVQSNEGAQEFTVVTLVQNNADSQ